MVSGDTMSGKWIQLISWSIDTMKQSASLSDDKISRKMDSTYINITECGYNGPAKLGPVNLHKFYSFADKTNSQSVNVIFTKWTVQK